MKPALDPGSPAQASLPILQLPLSRSLADLLDCVARKFAGLSVGPAWLLKLPIRGLKSLGAKTARCSAALLGKPSIASRFAHQIPKESREPRRATGRFLFRRLFPTDPKKKPKVFPIACRRRSDLWSPAYPIAPFPTLRGGRDRRPDHMSTMHSPPSRGSKIFGNKPVDNGDIGSNSRNLATNADMRLRASRRRAARCCRSVPPVLPPTGA